MCSSRCRRDSSSPARSLVVRPFITRQERLLLKRRGSRRILPPSTVHTRSPDDLSPFPQVNAREFSKVEHEGTVAEAIRRDPIVVQVLRRPPTRGGGVSPDVHVTDVCTQTDITFEHIMALAKLRPATPPVPDICPFLLSDR